MKLRVSTVRFLTFLMLMLNSALASQLTRESDDSSNPCRITQCTLDSSLYIATRCIGPMIGGYLGTYPVYPTPAFSSKEVEGLQSGLSCKESNHDANAAVCSGDGLPKYQTSIPECRGYSSNLFFHSTSNGTTASALADKLKIICEKNSRNNDITLLLTIVGVSFLALGIGAAIYLVLPIWKRYRNPRLNSSSATRPTPGSNASRPRTL